MTARNYVCKVAQWNSGSLLVLNPGRYLVDFESKKTITLESIFLQQPKMVLLHEKSHGSSKVFTFEYLEPFQNGSCHSHRNCLRCLTDALCGWCEVNQRCLPRNLSEIEVKLFTFYF